MAIVLHVEDEDIWVNLIRDLLPEHQVDSAHTQQEALRLLVTAKHPYDVALVDLDLGNNPDAGREVLDALTLMDPHVHRVVITGTLSAGGQGDFAERYRAEEVLFKANFAKVGLLRVVAAAAHGRQASLGADRATQRRSVFIAGAHSADRPYVTELARYLVAAGIDTRYDDERLTSQRWVEVVKAQIDASAAFIIVMTPEALSEPSTTQELSRAIEMGKPIFPLLLNGEGIPSVSRWEWDDVTGGRLPGAHIVDRLYRLVVQR